MSSVNTPPAKPRKGKLYLFVLLIFTLVSVAVLLAFGLGGQIMGDYNKRFWIETTQGTAESLSSSDPHVIKADDEYRKLVLINQNAGVDGVFEKVSAGDYQYETITEESLGQYAIDSFFFYEDDKAAAAAFADMQKLAGEIGYAQDEEIEASDSSVSLLRTFVPSEEGSAGAPGNDHISMSMFKRESGTTIIVFIYRSTELPLSGIPKNGDTYKVVELEEYEDKVFSDEIDTCSLQPNGAVGGWYPDLECYKKDL